jgi:hypothetical protein
MRGIVFAVAASLTILIAIGFGPAYALSGPSAFFAAVAKKNALAQRVGYRQLSSYLPGRPGGMQNRGGGNFGRGRGAFHGRPGFTNHGAGNFSHFSGSFREWPRFRGVFGRGRHDFGPNIVIVPSVAVPPPLSYDAPPPPPGYGSLSCFNGWEPLNGC